MVLILYYSIKFGPIHTCAIRCSSSGFLLCQCPAVVAVVDNLLNLSAYLVTFASSALCE